MTTEAGSAGDTEDRGVTEDGGVTEGTSGAGGPGRTVGPGGAERRVPPGVAGSEREMLENWLDFQRATLAAKCAGLDDAQLRQASARPSGLMLLGLVKHLTDVERSWFRRVFGQQDAPPLYYTEEDLDGDFRTEGDSVPELYAAWGEEIAAARECTAAAVWRRRWSARTTARSTACGGSTFT